MSETLAALTKYPKEAIFGKLRAKCSNKIERLITALEITFKIEENSRIGKSLSES